MPDITSAGTYTKAEIPGFAELYGRGKRILKLSGSSISAVLQAKTDTGGVFAAYSNGSITSLPTEVVVNDMAELQLVVTGSPNFNITVSPGV